jgi:hypothetical protein
LMLRLDIHPRVVGSTLAGAMLQYRV